VQKEDVLLILQEKLIVTIVLLDPTPPTKDPLDALNAHPVPMPARLVPYLVKIVIPIPTNGNPTLRNVSQCKKGTTNRAQQRKWNVQRVKEETVVMKLVNNATKEDFKRWRETPHV